MPERDRPDEVGRRHPAKLERRSLKVYETVRIATMGEYLLVSDDVRRAAPLAESLSIDHPCRIHDLYDDKVPDLRPRVVISDVSRLTSDALVRLQRCLERIRGKGVPYLFIAHGNLTRAEAHGNFLSATELLPAADAYQHGLAKLRQLDEEARPISALTHKHAARAHSFVQTVFFSGQPVTPSAADAGTGLIVAAVGEVCIRDWVRTVQSFDDVTYQHILLVAGLSTAFATTLGLNQSDKYHLTKGALLHDVGKVKIPSAILNKPGKFDPDELAVMRSHAALGYDMLRGGGFADDTLAVVRSHHEMLDGSGYPDRLRGADIPDLVRLITVCDIYAALIERRPYKTAMPHTKALSILHEMEGRLDPDIVRAFHPVVDSLDATKSQMAA